MKFSSHSFLVLGFVIIGLLLSTIYCDIYMHNPRGSNNRNCEKNGNRQNANRLFDSQNNAAGGYACPRAVGAGSNTETFYYYSGSVLPVQWTSQHQCGGDKSQCQVVIQTMCEKWDEKASRASNQETGLRDGLPNSNTDTATSTIDTANYNNPRYGRHEPLEYYQQCSQRKRNTNLWIADRNVDNNDGAGATRQNNNGNRHGLECAEERDYYPYWHPTPWIDVAYFTNNKTQCPEIQEASENVVKRNLCSVSEHNNEDSCRSGGGTWIEKSYYDEAMLNRIGKPECIAADETISARDNHLGSVAQTGNMATYNWTIPEALEGMKCVLRIRYNISTGEIPFTMDKAYNKAASPVYQDLRSEEFGYAAHVELAMNTNQYGRTFQDRSYVFRVKKRPDEFNGRRIYNLNVRGKRGNIVQTYPSVEYDFVPNFLHVKYPDLVHIQWTGSDYNPARNPNDAEGGPLDIVDNQRRADRSNLFQCEGVSDISTNIPRALENVTLFRDPNNQVDTHLINQLAFPGIYNKNNPKIMDSLCKKLADLDANDANARETDPKNCAKLNAATNPYFDAGLVELRNNGYFCIVSTRNNNFSNRSQKGRLLVTGAPFDAASTSTISLATMLFMVVALMFIM